MPFAYLDSILKPFLVNSREITRKIINNIMVKMQLNEFSTLLDFLYQGALEVKPWQTFLSHMRKTFDLHHAVIVIRPPSENYLGIFITSGVDIPKTIPKIYGNSYTEQYFELDPLNNLPFERVVTLEELVSDSEYATSDYCQKCLKPLHVRYVAGIDYEGENNNNFNIRLSRNETQEPFSEKEIELLRLLVPHIKRAITYGIRELHSHSEKQVYSDSMAGRSVGILTLDENGYIVSSNKVATKYLQDKDGLSERHNHLQLNDSQANDEFKSRFSDIISAQKSRQIIPARALAVPRKSSKLDYELVLKPMPINRYIDTKGSPHLMVFIHDPEINIDISVHLIVALYNLTVSEAMLTVLLTEGKSLDEVAVIQGIAKNTARAHLRSIFAKVGVSKQSMLVSLISKSIASVG